MRDLIILTDKPINKESCIQLIKKEFKSKKTISETEDFLYMKGNGAGFEIDFTPNDKLSDPLSDMDDDTIEKCPNKNAYLTNLSYTTNYVAAKVIMLLMPLYGRMWIDDEELNIFSTAEEFVDRMNTNK